MKAFFIELPFIQMIEVIDYTYLYLKNLYFKSLRQFVLWVYPTYQYLTNIFTLKSSSLIKN
ncbi:orotate phosphoribosyltransferase [Helicobacter pylori]